MKRMLPCSTTKSPGAGTPGLFYSKFWKWQGLQPEVVSYIHTLHGLVYTQLSMAADLPCLPGTLAFLLASNFLGSAFILGSSLLISNTYLYSQGPLPDRLKISV